MPSIDDLNRRFAIPNVARFEAGGGGMIRLAVNAPAAEGHVYLYGAHVTHYQLRGQPRGGGALFLSEKTFFEAGKPIRGGVPIIFPWFGPRQDGREGPMHGLVRTMDWSVAEVKLIGDAVTAVFTLASNDQTRSLWPHDFSLRFAITLGRSLDMQLTVNNTGARPFVFEEALHTYLAVADVRTAALTGLSGASYLDKNLGLERRTDSETILYLTGPTDRVYESAAACVIDDNAPGGNRRRITVAKQNSHSTVVWNPWSDKIATFADLAAHEWPTFLCVETCNVKDQSLTLAAGASHTMGAALSADSAT